MKMSQDTPECVINSRVLPDVMAVGIIENFYMAFVMGTMIRWGVGRTRMHEGCSHYQISASVGDRDLFLKMCFKNEKDATRYLELVTSSFAELLPEMLEGRQVIDTSMN